MQTSAHRFAAIATPLFITALLLLALNDHVLKAAYGNALTGKLSDFAGLFAFAVFFASLAPRHAAAICAACGALFAFWKLPVSTPFVAMLPVDRVVDVTDLLALLVLPFAWLFVRMTSARPARTAMVVPIAIASIVCFAATSPPRQWITIDDDDPAAIIPDAPASSDVFRQCGMEVTDYGESFVLQYDSRVVGPKRRMRVHLTRSGSALRMNGITIMSQRTPVNELQVRQDAVERIRKCLTQVVARGTRNS